MASKRKTQSRRKSRRVGRKSRRVGRKLRRGGNSAGSAAAYGEAVYGSAGQQHAQAGGNQIAENYIQNN